jgi:hypothetical protein
VPLALRTRQTDSQAIDRSFDDGAFIRTHVLRPTWHFVAPEDLRWMVALTGPRVIAGNASRHRQLELDKATLRRSLDVLSGALEGGRSRTREQLGAALQAAGISPTGQRLPHILGHAELQGLICSGPLRGMQHTFGLLEERVAPAPAISREQALAALVRRYFASHGPATLNDFAWWSGLTVADGRRGLAAMEPDAERVVIDDKVYWTADAGHGVRATNAPVVHLLPNFDELTVAYRDHATSTDPRAHDALAHSAGGVLANVVTLDGLVVGRWRRASSNAEAAVQVNLSVALTDGERDALGDAAGRFGRFLGLPVALEALS